MKPSERAAAVEAACLRYGAPSIVDPWDYAAEMDGGPVGAFQRYLTASRVRWFSAVEVLTPSEAGQEAARACGWPNGIPWPPAVCWPTLLLLTLMSDHLRDVAGGPIVMRNSYRPFSVNRAVATSSEASDHPHAAAVDLDVSTAGDASAARDEARVIYGSPLGELLGVSLGLYESSPRTIHLGVCSPLGRRAWGPL